MWSNGRCHRVLQRCAIPTPTTTSNGASLLHRSAPVVSGGGGRHRKGLVGRYFIIYLNMPASSALCGIGYLTTMALLTPCRNASSSFSATPKKNDYLNAAGTTATTKTASSSCTATASPLSSVSRCTFSMHHPAYQTSHCTLCDTPFMNWPAHCQSSTHVARVAIGEAFVKPERSASMLTQLQEHIGMDFAVVDEAAAQKGRRRQRRLRSSLDYLRTENVLHRCVLQTDQSSCSVPSFAWTVRDGFMTCAAVGDAHAREHLTDRVARLAPRSSGRSLRHMVEYLCAPRQWSRLFDLLQLENVLCATPMPTVTTTAGTQATTTSSSEASLSLPLEDGGDRIESSALSCERQSDSEELPPTGEKKRKTVPRLTQQEKSLVFRSCIGELHLFTQRDRSHQVDSKDVTEKLVYHVLASHCVDNLLAELLHHVMETVVHESTPVWRAYQVQEERMRMRSYQSAPPLLSPVPQKRGMGTDTTPTAGAAGASSHATPPRLDASLRGLFPTLQRPSSLTKEEEKPITAASSGAERLSPSSSSSSAVPIGSPSGLGAQGLDTARFTGVRHKRGGPTTLTASSSSSGSASSSASSSTIPRGPWQEAYRQLLFERPMVPATTPGATFAPFHPRLHPEPR